MSNQNRRLIIVNGYSGKYQGDWALIYLSQGEPDPKEGNIDWTKWRQFCVTDFFRDEGISMSKFMEEFPGLLRPFEDNIDNWDGAFRMVSLPNPGEKEELKRLVTFLNMPISVFISIQMGETGEFQFTVDL